MKLIKPTVILALSMCYLPLFADGDDPTPPNNPNPNPNDPTTEQPSEPGHENNENNNGNNASQTELELEVPDRPGAPRSHSNHSISCIYFHESLFVSFPEDCSYMNIMVVLESGQMFQGSINNADSGFYIPEANGLCRIICHTNTNQTYSGYIYIN